MDTGGLYQLCCENNIRLQRQRLLTQSKEADLLASRMSLLPDLNAGIAIFSLQTEGLLTSLMP